MSPSTTSARCARIPPSNCATASSPAARSAKRRTTAGAWAELAEACHIDGDRRAALEAIDQAVRLSCGRPDYALTAGLLWLEAGAPGRAEALLHLAAGSSRLAGPRRAEALHALARAALHRGRLQLAGDLLDAALRLSPQDGQIWNTLGVLAVRGRRGTDAAAALARAAELRPGDVSPLLNLGILYDEARQPEQAIRLPAPGARARSRVRGSAASAGRLAPDL